MTEGPREFEQIAALLARLSSLPPLGLATRHKYSGFLHTACELLRADGAAVGFWVSPHELRRTRVRAGDPAEATREDVLDPREGESSLRRALKTASAEILAPGLDPRWTEELEAFPDQSTKSCLVQGLRMHDEPPAVVSFHRFHENAFRESDRVLAQSIAPNFAAALQNLRRFAHAEELSITDGLTGVFNYRFLRTAMDREISRAKRFQEPFTIIMLDVDHLKDYNDVYGHLQGSEVLRRVAQVVAAALREVDILAKYGGDEFVAILPRTDRQGAAILAERIRAAVEEHGFPGEGGRMKITSSMGIAEFPGDGQSSRDLLEAADAALYEAKRSGRNRVTPVATSTSPE